jgi:hypothetical protein
MQELSGYIDARRAGMQALAEQHDLQAQNKQRKTSDCLKLAEETESQISILKADSEAEMSAAEAEKLKTKQYCQSWEAESKAKMVCVKSLFVLCMNLHL